jgi:hypothetical protein
MAGRFLLQSSFYARAQKRRFFMMLGMQDLTTALAWLLTVCSMVFGVIFGLIYWNREEDERI